VPEDQAAVHIAAGRLEHLLADWSPVFAGLRLYYPANRHPPAALRLFAQAVRDWGMRK
jgi:DNA-binding transcriptional LysR family regulator